MKTFKQFLRDSSSPESQSHAPVRIPAKRRRQLTEQIKKWNSVRKIAARP
jgi:hypothetical protein